MASLRVGIVGTGSIAQEHVKGYLEGGVEVVAVCDVSPETLARRQTEWGVKNGYLAFEDLLADASIDAISICTPTFSHHPVAVAAAKAGKHVLCEKPVSMDIAQAEEMIGACSAAGVVFQVGHHMRSWAAAVKAKEIIESGDLGEITYVRLRQAHDWAGAKTVRGAFASREASGGGTLLDNGCHLFDLARYFAGDVDNVFARVATRKFDIEVEDTAVASLGFQSGAMGQVEVAWTGTGWQEAFWVFGTEGSLECDNRVSSTELLHRYRKSGAQTWADTDLAHHTLRGRPSHTQHVINFIEAIEGVRNVVCSGSDGLEAVRLVHASYASATNAAMVKVATIGASS